MKPSPAFLEPMEPEKLFYVTGISNSSHDEFLCAKEHTVREEGKDTDQNNVRTNKKTDSPL